MQGTQNLSLFHLLLVAFMLKKLVLMHDDSWAQTQRKIGKNRDDVLDNNIHMEMISDCQSYNNNIDMETKCHLNFIAH